MLALTLFLRPSAVACLGPIRQSLAAAVAAAVIAAGCLALPAAGGVVFEATGTSAAGNPVAVRATLAITGDELTLDLENISPVDTSEPADVLASFYFDIARDGKRPALGFRSAFGQVVRVLKGAADEPVIYTPPAMAGGKGSVTEGLGCSDLMATKRGDLTWQFRQLDPAFEPLAGFGLGTVGNANLKPANFDPQIVGTGDFAIYRGRDIEPKGNLPGRFLAQSLVRFTFGGVADWSEADVVPRATFGLGTGPDSVICVSEPAATPAVFVAAAGLAVFGGRGRRPQAARRVGQASTPPAVATSPASSAALSRPAGLACRPISRETNTAM